MDRCAKMLDDISPRVVTSWVLVATVASLPVTGYLTARFIDEYRGWLNMGRGGLPYNFYGYCVNLYLTFRFGRRDTISSSLFDYPEKNSPAWANASRDEKANAQKSWLMKPLPIRPGPRARAIHYCAPQREKNAGQYIDEELKQKYASEFENLVTTNSEALEWKTSVLERRGRAIFLKEAYDLPNPLAYARRELAHLHDSDTSAHILLSFEDARQVLSKGWGERHQVAGTIAPLGYMFLYQPRNVEEVEVFLEILKASVAYGKSNGKTKA